ncbi:hypothetical protein [Nibrella viscosa]|uniref:hypothetical protein n=1 Tax=Nibrella viscosa TaxID=1084524 RepID=UPI0031F13FC4
MTTSLARVLSALFHPLLMPTLLFGILLFQVPGVIGLDAFSERARLSLLLLIAIGTFGVPALLIYYLYRQGLLSSLHMDDRSERRLPYLITGLIYTFLTFLFAFRMQLVSETAPEVAIILGSITVSILLVGLISLFWKISAHSVGIGGSLGALLGIMLKFSATDLFLSLVALTILAGLVASARLHLNAHTPAQIGTGLALGLTVSLVTVVWLV